MLAQFVKTKLEHMSDDLKRLSLKGTGKTFPQEKTHLALYCLWSTRRFPILQMSRKLGLVYGTVRCWRTQRFYQVMFNKSATEYSKFFIKHANVTDLDLRSEIKDYAEEVLFRILARIIHQGRKTIAVSSLTDLTAKYFFVRDGMLLPHDNRSLRQLEKLDQKYSHWHYTTMLRLIENDQRKNLTKYIKVIRNINARRVISCS